jgi:hypothetical protein
MRNWNVFDIFPKNHMKMLLEDFNNKVGREDISKPTIGNESLHEISNDNGVGVVNFATSTNLTVKSMMFTRCNIHKYTWTSPDGKRVRERLVLNKQRSHRFHMERFNLKLNEV